MKHVRCGAALASSVMLFAAVGCGGDGGGGGGADAAVTNEDSGGGGGSDSGGGDMPMLVDQIGCHMVGTDYSAIAVPPDDASTPQVFIVVTGPFNCFATNTNPGGDYVWFEWEPGSYHNIKAFGWTAVSSTHGEVTQQTNADSGILGIPVSTPVTAKITADDDGRTFDIAFRWEEDYVVFTKIAPPGGW